MYALRIAHNPLTQYLFFNEIQYNNLMIYFYFYIFKIYLSANQLK